MQSVEGKIKELKERTRTTKPKQTKKKNIYIVGTTRKVQEVPFLWSVGHFRSRLDWNLIITFLTQYLHLFPYAVL
jgi:hypothetical protein